MKTIALIAIAAATLTASLAASAEGATYDYPPAVTATGSRAETRAELRDALAAGTLNSGERSYVAPATGWALSRAQVRAELDAARANHALAHGEFAYLQSSNVSRQDALARAGSDRVMQ